MGGIFHGHGEIDDAYGEDARSSFDASAVCCPRCGCNAVEILSYPSGDPPRLVEEGGRRHWEGRWFGSHGRAVCAFCETIFAIESDGE